MENYLNLYNMLKSELASLNESLSEAEEKLKDANSKYDDIAANVDQEIRSKLCLSTNLVEISNNRIFALYHRVRRHTLIIMVIETIFTAYYCSKANLELINFLLLFAIISLATLKLQNIMCPILVKKEWQKLKNSDECLESEKALEKVNENLKNLYTDQRNLYQYCEKLKINIDNLKIQIATKERELEEIVKRNPDNVSEKESLICTLNKEEASENTEKPLTRIRKKEIGTTN